MIIRLTEDMYPLTVISTRYNSPGSFVAFNLDPDGVPAELNWGDVDMEKAWRELESAQGYYWAHGDTIEDALTNLCVDYYFHDYQLERYLADLKQEGAVLSIQIGKVTISMQEVCQAMAKRLDSLSEYCGEYYKTKYDKLISILKEFGFSVDRVSDWKHIVEFSQRTSAAEETHIFE